MKKRNRFEYLNLDDIPDSRFWSRKEVQEYFESFFGSDITLQIMDEAFIVLDPRTDNTYVLKKKGERWCGAVSRTQNNIDVDMLVTMFTKFKTDTWQEGVLSFLCLFLAKGKMSKFRELLKSHEV